MADDYVVTAVQDAVGLPSRADAELLIRQLEDAGLLRRPPRPPAAEHGTTSSYERCRKRPQGSCAECRAAKRAYMERWADRRDPSRPRRKPDLGEQLPGGGSAQREWNRLSTNQKLYLRGVHVDNFVVANRALVRKGLRRQDRQQWITTPRGRALLNWAAKNYPQVLE